MLSGGPAGCAATSVQPPKWQPCLIEFRRSRVQCSTFQFMKSSLPQTTRTDGDPEAINVSLGCSDPCYPREQQDRRMAEAHFMPLLRKPCLGGDMRHSYC
eukprot:XP_001710322.1 Hypothetical protein GL50803_100580 [Giardia lamblia ATCC 50803]